MTEDTLTRNQVKLILEHRLLELEHRIRALSGNDRKYASDKNHLKSLYNLNLRLAKNHNLLDNDDTRVYL
jgi:hypothetical protein